METDTEVYEAGESVLRAERDIVLREMNHGISYEPISLSYIQ